MLAKIKKIIKNQREFLSSVLLIISAFGAVYMANSDLSEVYHDIINYPISLMLGSYFFEISLHHFVNEALMTLFFFVVGMEVKKELSGGELSLPRKASLPVLAALGGMIVPALIYYFFNKSNPSSLGWGIPMATDIAFVIGLLALVSRKVPFGLKIFLLTLAIIDDIGAALVIALYYSHSLSGPFLALSLVISFLLFLYFKLGLRNIWLFNLLALALWFSVLHTGVHVTISGVILGILIPSKRLVTGKQATDAVKRAFNKEADLSLKELSWLGSLIKDTHPPLFRLLSPWQPIVLFIIMPLFAFFNAGINFSLEALTEAWHHPVFLGIFAGLLIGKPLGIFSFSYLGVRLGIAELPKHVNWKQIFAAGLLAGVGFTMSLFIGNLSFENMLSLQGHSKISILISSLLAGILSLACFLFMKNVPKAHRVQPNPRARS